MGSILPCCGWVAGVVGRREEMSTQELFPTADVISWRAGAPDTLWKSWPPVWHPSARCWLLSPTGLLLLLLLLLPSEVLLPAERFWVRICIQTQSFQDKPRSLSDLLAQPAIFVFFWLCFIYFFTLCSITAGSLSSCPLMFSLSAKCQLSLPAG